MHTGSMRLGIRRRVLGAIAASTLAVGGLIALGGPASAVTTTVNLVCGQTVSGNVRAANNLGPCTSGDAIKVTSGTVLDLAGHSIQCDNAHNNTVVEQVGIHLMNVTGVKVSNGQVFNCDAGVAIDGGGHNTVSAIYAHDNIAHVLVAGPADPTNPIGTPCNFGDGIVTDNSNGNTIKGNRAIHNGPYSGIALVDASGSNQVIGNLSRNNTVSNMLPNGIHNPPDVPGGPPGDQNGPCGPFSATATGEGRLHQDIGIRVEGPGATNNTVLGNTSTDNQLEGISIHGNVCFIGGDPGLPRGAANSGNVIKGNSVVHNGFANAPGQRPELLGGIEILRQGPFGTIVCGAYGNTIIGNSSVGNARDGVFVPPTGDPAQTSRNTVDYNTVTGNGRDGIHLDGPFTVCPFGAGNSGPPNFTCNVPREARNGSNDNSIHDNRAQGNGTNRTAFAPRPSYDGFDGNPGCDNNVWFQDVFVTVNQPCVH